MTISSEFWIGDENGGIRQPRLKRLCCCLAVNERQGTGKGRGTDTGPKVCSPCRRSWVCLFWRGLHAPLVLCCHSVQAMEAIAQATVSVACAGVRTGRWPASAAGAPRRFLRSGRGPSGSQSISPSVRPCSEEVSPQRGTKMKQLPRGLQANSSERIADHR